MAGHRRAKTKRLSGTLAGLPRLAGPPPDLQLGAERNGGEEGGEDADAFTFRIGTWTKPDGHSIVEHVAGIEDYELSLGTFRLACEERTSSAARGAWPASHGAYRRSRR
jgi:hypothetical protein